MSASDSPAGPLALLAACLLPVAGALAVDSPRVGVTLLLLEIVALGWLVRYPRSTLLRCGVGLVAGATLGLSTWLYAGHSPDKTVAAILRIMCIVVPAAIASPSIRPSALGDHLAQRLRLPGRPVAAAVAALQRIEHLVDQWTQIQQARRARGLGADGNPVRWVAAMSGGAFALFVGAMRSSAQLAVAMDARGFATAQGRTWAEPAPWRFRDTVVVVLSSGLAVIPWLV